MRSPDVQGYLSDLRQTYPPETAEQLLESLQRNGSADAPTAAASPPAARTGRSGCGRPAPGAR
jgi:hypothetical protein